MDRNDGRKERGRKTNLRTGQRDKGWIHVSSHSKKPLLVDCCLALLSVVTSQCTQGIMMPRDMENFQGTRLSPYRNPCRTFLSCCWVWLSITCIKLIVVMGLVSQLLSWLAGQFLVSKLLSWLASHLISCSCSCYADYTVVTLSFTIIIIVLQRYYVYHSHFVSSLVFFSVIILAIKSLLLIIVQ